MWRALKKRLVAKFGSSRSRAGSLMYAVLRAFQIRPSRMPKPTSKKHGS